MPAKFTDVEAAARREEILAAVGPVFAKHGYEGTTVAALEAATGLSRGGIFFHFGSKRELYLAAVRSCYLRSRPALRDAVLHGRGGTVPSMLRLFEMFVTYTRKRPEAHLFMRQVRANRGTQPDAAALYREMDDQVYAYYGRLCAELQQRGALNRDVDPEAVARVYGAVVERLLEYSLDHSHEETMDQARRAFEILANGVATRRSPDE